MAAQSNDYGSWFVILMLFAWIVWGGTPHVGEVTRYAAMCPQAAKDGRCETPIWLQPSTFRAIPEAQVVIEIVADSPAYKHANCAVMDKQNWSCKGVDGSMFLYMTDGAAMPRPNAMIRYFSWLEKLQCNKWLPLACPADTGWLPPS